MNIQLLEDPSKEISLCLIYGGRWYLHETAESHAAVQGKHNQDCKGNTEVI